MNRLFWPVAWLAGATIAPTLASELKFEPVPAESSGIQWVHDNAMSKERHLPETTGAGCAFLDYNNDGWMDIYLVNSGAADFFTPSKPLRNALYRNNGDGTFTDVTAEAGVEGGRFGMGVAVADYDGDGWQDIYVTNYGQNLLYRNNGDGTFAEVAEKAGVAVTGWSTSAAWFDFDNDGRLDLFVCRYVEYEAALSEKCTDDRKRRRYCVPRLFRPTQSYLFRNNGDGTFADVSRKAGIAPRLGKAFGVVATDVNNDGLMDLFVSSDMWPNSLFLNNGDGTFEDVGLLAGVAYSEDGAARSGMGVDAVDFDGDGWQDLLVANIDHERFALYRNLGDGTFIDEGGEVRESTYLFSGWGLRFMDYNNDGTPDLFLANGHPDDMVGDVLSGVKYKQPLLLLENIGGAFKNISSRSGAVFARDFAARGLAAGDFDNDGRLDLLISNNGDAPLLLRNQSSPGNNWVGLNLVATRSNPAGVGAVIRWPSGGGARERLKTGGGSYLSSHDPREIIGLGSAAKVDWLEIRWPSGQVDRLTDVPLNQYLTAVEGAGSEVISRRRKVEMPHQQ